MNRKNASPNGEPALRSELQIGDTLWSLAHQVDRLAPSHRDPHAFHEAKNEIAHTLRMLASGAGVTPSKDEKLRG